MDDPAVNFATGIAGVVNTGGKFAQQHRRQIATGINDTDSKFAIGVNDTGGK